MSEHLSLNLISSLSPKELTRFSEFIRTPFFNTNPDVVKVFDIITGPPGIKKSGQITDKMLFSMLYHEKKYNNKKVRYLFHYLTRLCEKFISITGSDESRVEEQINILKELARRNLDKNFKMKLKEIQKNLKRSELPAEKYFFYLTEIKKTEGRFNYYKKDFSLNISTLQEEGDSLILFFLSAMVNYYFNIKLAEEQSNISPGNTLFTDFIKSFDLYGFTQEAAAEESANSQFISLLYSAYMLKAAKDGEEHYENSLKLIAGLKNELSKNDLWDFYSSMERYLGDMILKGNSNYTRRLFELYKMHLENNVTGHAPGKYFNTILFRNIASVAIYLGESGWVKGFIKTYSARLDPDHKSDIVNLVYANLLFSDKDYTGSLKKTSRINLNFFLAEYDIRNLIIRNFYELGNYQRVYELIDNYRHFLKKNTKVNDSSRILYGNFLKYVNLLLKLKWSNVKTAPEELLELLKNDGPVAAKKWLLEKITEMQKM